MVDSPPDAPPPNKRYITRDGRDRFQEELRVLWNVERRKVVSEVTVAAAHGDRSENAEYIYGKRRLREIDRRVQFLTKLLDEAVMVDPAERKASGKVLVGSFVTVEDEDGKQSVYQIVGRDEADAKTGRVSLESPLGRALIGKRPDDTVTFRRPKGDTELTVLEATDTPPAIAPRATGDR